ncbi:MAG TPA: 50S ribosomal protein L18e [Thermoplasmata archaeon]|nr:50S ribosomal protein L18e [Thermoplasmata archaeon]
MPPSIPKENSELVRTIVELRRAARAHDAPVWGAVADRLERARHQTTPVNVGHLNRLAAADETVVVPGKLLADGRLSKRLTVAAFAYSAEAKSKIHAAGGAALTLSELLKSKPDGTGVRLLA